MGCGLGFKRCARKNLVIRGLFGLLLFATLTIIVSAQSQSRPRALEYVRTTCSAHSAIYEPLVADLLSQYQSGFSTADLLRMPANYNGSRLQLEIQGALPMLYIINGQLWVDYSLSQPGGKRLKNLEYFGIPLLQQLSQEAGTYFGQLHVSYRNAH